MQPIDDIVKDPEIILHSSMTATVIDSKITFYSHNI